MERDPKYTRKSFNAPGRRYKTLGKAAITLEPGTEHAREWFDIELHRVKRPNGSEGLQWYSRVAPSSHVGHINEKGLIAFVINDERYPSGRASCEIPGGAIPPEYFHTINTLPPKERADVFRDTGIEEVRQEIGLILEKKDITPLFDGHFQNSISILDHEGHLFLATGGTPTEQHFDEGEQNLLTYVRHSINDAEAMLGYEIAEPFTAIAVQKIAQEYGTPTKSLLKTIHQFFRKIR